MVKKLVVGLMMVMMMAGTGLAYDYDTADCVNDPMANESDNVTCLGFVYNEVEMAEFVTAFNNSENLIIGYKPAEPPVIVDGGATGNIRYDNVRRPDGTYHSKISMTGALMNTKMIPHIRVYSVGQPGDDCTPDSDWHFNLCGETGGYNGPDWPVKVYSIDYDLTGESQQICEDQNWEWTPGDGSPCDLAHLDGDGDGLGDGFNTEPTMRFSGETVKASDVVNVEWIEGGEVATPRYSGYEEYYYMKFNTGLNAFEHIVTGQDHTVFFKYFTKAGELGPQNLIVTLTNGQTITSTNDVVSTMVMPTVSAYNDSLIFQKVKVKVKKGEEVIKIIDKERDITVVNLTAREIDGGRLLVTFKPMDEVFSLPEDPAIRLRIFIGEGWYNDQSGDDVTNSFLWMDAPLHSGFIVVPDYAYEWVKSKMDDNEIQIGGMYREQYSGYHNRGMIDGIRIEF